MHSHVGLLIEGLQNKRVEADYPASMPWVPGTNIYVEEALGRVLNGRQFRVYTVGVTAHEDVALLRTTSVYELDRDNAAEDVPVRVEGFRGQEEYPDYLMQGAPNHRFLAWLGGDGITMRGQVVHEPVGEVHEASTHKFRGLDIAKRNRLRIVRLGILGIVKDINRVLDGEHQVDVFADRLGNDPGLAKLE